MKKMLLYGAILLIIGSIIAVFMAPESEWSGVDESVVNKFAKEAGRPPGEPFINTAQGDVLLFCFLVAGAIGGFVAGYHYRVLFPPQVKSLGDSTHV